MPYDLSDSAARVDRPSGAFPWLGARVFLSTASESDRSILSSKFCIHLDAALVNVAEARRPVSKHQSKLNSLITDFKTLVRHFESNLWVELKESKFTTPLEKMSMMAASAAESCDKKIIDDANS